MLMTFECPKCSARTLPLFNSRFCPNGCDKIRSDILPSSKSVRFIVEGNIWRLIVVSANEDIPKHATNSWYMSESNRRLGTIDDCSLSWAKLAEAWEIYCKTHKWPTPGVDYIQSANEVNVKIAIFWRERQCDLE